MLKPLGETASSVKILSSSFYLFTNYVFTLNRVLQTALNNKNYDNE